MAIRFLRLLAPALLVLIALRARAWVPTGAQDLTLRRECRPEALSSKIVKNFGGSSKRDSFDPGVWTNFEGVVQGYFDDCGDELQRSSLSNVLDYAEMSLVTYDVRKHPRMKEVEFLLPSSGMKVRGLIALQNTSERRPLVIYKCGLTCDLYDPSMLFTLMVYYDMGPFHVLLLPSSSGEQFIKVNRRFAVGGLEEGRQLVEIARYIESGNWTYSKNISRIHLFGMSLGGHASLYAAMYADHLQLQSRETGPLFSSVFLGCPVVDFKPSLERVTGESVIAKILRRTIFKNVVEMLSFVPFFGQYFDSRDTSYNPTQGALQEMLRSGAINYYAAVTERGPWGTPPLEDVRFQESGELWDWMNFSKRPLDLLETPIYVWAPRNDDVVEFKTNTQQLVAGDKRQPQRKIFSLDTPLGGHCAFPSLYGWAGASAMMNALFLARSPEIVSKLRVIDIKFPRKLGYKARASARRQRTDATWIAVENKPYITLRMQYREVPCRLGTGGPQRCNGFETMKFSYAELGLSDANIPKSSVEAHGFTRWLNGRLKMLDAEKRALTQSENPEYLRWIRL